MSNTVEIHEVCDIFDGPHATPKKTATGPIYLGIDAITADCRLNPVEYNYLSEEDYRIWTKRVTPVENDIVFSYEATLGRYAMIPADFYGCLGRRLALIRVKDNRINPTWLYYYFMSPEWKVFVANHTVKGSTVDRISVEAFPSYKIPLIERQKQDDVVKILKSIDDKIENNNTICSELESMAKTLYDYWFAQFDFPDENGKPYRTSGGEMVWNEQLKREIPSGWSAVRLGDICTFRNGINYKKGCDGDFLCRIVNVRNITATSYLMDTNDFDIICLPNSQAVRYVVGRDDIIIARSGTPGATRLIINPEDNVIFCGFIICTTPVEPMYRYFLYHYLKQLEGTNATKTGGSILQNVSQDTLKSLLVCLPAKDTVVAFNGLLEPLIAKMDNIIHENRELIKLRDWLLPMLMNGQATVVDAEEKAGKVIPYTPQTVEVRQAARNFGDTKTDDTADLVQAYLRRKQHDSKTQKRS